MRPSDSVKTSALGELICLVYHAPVSLPLQLGAPVGNPSDPRSVPSLILPPGLFNRKKMFPQMSVFESQKPVTMLLHVANVSEALKGGNFLHDLQGTNVLQVEVGSKGVRGDETETIS